MSAPRETTTMYIGGHAVPASRTDLIPVVNPATEEVFALVPSGTSADVDDAVAAARAAFPSWSSTPPAERSRVLSRLKELMEQRRAELVETIVAEVGTPARVADAVQVGLPIIVVQTYVDLLGGYEFHTRMGNSTVLRDPIGVVGAITPWNYPLHQTIAKVVPAIAAGCTVVHKPSEIAPLTAFLLAEMFTEAGLPAGVYNVVTGTGADVGNHLVRHPNVDMISFTGSTGAGRSVGAAAAETVKRVTLELGGKSANVLLADADLENAVSAGVKNAFLNSGQTCTALSRMLVHRHHYDEAVSIAAATAKSLQPRLGPVATAAQWDRVQGYIQLGIEEGATLVAGGTGMPADRDVGFYTRATVFRDVDPMMRIAQEEIFGPVLCMIPYDTEDEAVAIANGTPYGLAAGVWSASEDKAFGVASRLRAGQVDINGARFNPTAPFGGYGLSGNGRELGEAGFEEFFELKSIQQ